MRRFVAAGVVLVALAVGVAAATILRDGGPGDGPLDGANGTSFLGPEAVGAVVSSGLDIVRVEGDKPAVIETVEVLGLSGPIRFLGVHTMRLPRENGTFTGDYGFPPSAWPTKPLSEQHVVPVSATRTAAGTPEEALQLVIGVKVTGPGIARYRAVEVTYRVDGRRYREIFANPIYLCAPESEYENARERCPGNVERVFEDRSALVRA